MNTDELELSAFIWGFNRYLPNSLDFDGSGIEFQNSPASVKILLPT
jgi:hypothetical protein